MFLLDSLMIAGIRWTLNTVVAAADAELNDDSVYRQRLLEAEMQREMGEISDEEFATIEAELLQAIREIRERRDGGATALAFDTHPPGTAGHARFEVEAELTGEFHARSAEGGERSSDPSRTDRRSRPGRPTRSSRVTRSRRT